jgi:hypothetical protein
MQIAISEFEAAWSKAQTANGVNARGASVGTAAVSPQPSRHHPTRFGPEPGDGRHAGRARSLAADLIISTGPWLPDQPSTRAWTAGSPAGAGLVCGYPVIHSMFVGRRPLVVTNSRAA